MKRSPEILITTIFALVVMLTLASGCDFFSTREPDNPVGDRIGTEIAVSSDEVLDRMVQAFALRDPDLYMSIIDSGFVYSASLSAYPENPAIFEDWGYLEEDRFVRTLLNVEYLPTEAEVTYVFDIASEDVLSGDLMLLQGTYSLFLALTREDLPNQYEGLINLQIVRGTDGGWRVLSWEDEAGGGEATMSRLRADI